MVLPFAAIGAFFRSLTGIALIAALLVIGTLWWQKSGLEKDLETEKKAFTAVAEKLQATQKELGLARSMGKAAWISYQSLLKTVVVGMEKSQIALKERETALEQAKKIANQRKKSLDDVLSGKDCAAWAKIPICKAVVDHIQGDSR